MEQVFRIEIPVEVTSKSDLGKVQQIQAILEKADQEARKLASSADSAFNRISSGASSAASAMDQVNSAAQKSSDAMDKVGEATDEMGENAEEAADSMDEIGDAAKDAGNAAKGAFDGAGQSADKFSQRMEKSERSLRSMFKEKFKMTMEAIDKISPVIKDIKEKVKSLAAKAWKVTVKLADLVTAPFRALKNMIMSPITMTLSIAGIGLGASSFYQTFTEFEAGMSNVKALSGATDEEFKKLTATASELGATTKFTAAEASEGMQYLAMAGWKTNDIIAGMPGLLQLAAAGGTDLGTAADIVSDVMTAMGMSAEEATRAADIFAKTATSSNTTISMMGETLKYAAPIAHSFGLELSEVATITGMMANAGIKGGSAGTAIRTALLRMASPSKEAAKAMSALGLTFSDDTGKMKDMQTIMKDLGTAFRGLSEQEKLAYADDIFGKNAASAWLSVIEQGESAYNDLFQAIDKSEGAAQEMSEIQLDNLAGDVTLLQSAVDGMKVSLMDKLNPYLRSGVQWITAQIPALTEAIGNFIDKGIAKAKELKELIGGVFNSEEFQNADSLADKFFIAWDKIIAEPFNAWWEGSGREFVLGIVKKVGSTFGEVLHGVVAGIFAAIKGEEIDFEGLNLTGIAKAGAEAAKEYVTSFVGGLDAGNLVSEMPGSLKAGLLGFGALKLGSGAIGIAKTVGQLRLAFGGITTTAAAATTTMATAGEAAAAAGASAATGASAFSGLGTALAAIPGWGWAALAALAAVGVGYKIYHDQQEKQREKLLHLGDEVEAAGQRYVEAVQRVQDLDTTLEGIQEIKLKITEDKQQNEEVIAQVKGEIDGILKTDLVLTATLEKNGYNTGEAKEIIGQLREAVRLGKEEQILELKTKLVDLGYDEDQVDRIIDQMKEVNSKEVTLTATLESSGYNALQAGIIMAQYKALKEDEEGIAIEISAHTNLAEENVAALTTDLTELMAMKAEKEIKLSGYGLSTLQIASLKSQLKKMEERKAEIEILVSEGEGTPELMAEYNTLTGEAQAIQLKLEGAAMSEDEYNAMTEQVNDLKAAVGGCVVTLTKDPDSTFTDEDVDKLMGLLGTAGDHYWQLGVNLATGSVTPEDLETYNQQLEAYAQHLEEISGGMIKADEVMSGDISEETQQKIDTYGEIEQMKADAAYNRLVAANLREEREGRPANLEKRAAAQEELDAASSRAADLSSLITDLDYLREAGAIFNAEDAAAREKYTDANGNLTTDYLAWDEQHVAAFGEQEHNGVKYKDLIDSIEGRFAALGLDIGNGVTWEDVISPNSGVSIEDLFTEYASSTRDILADAQDAQAAASEKYNEANGQLIKDYQGQLAEKTYAANMGTEYAGKSVDELAAGFNGLDADGIKAFTNAVEALNAVNTSADYISDEDKISTRSIAESAYQSVTSEGNNRLMDYTRTGIQGVESQYKNMVNIAAAGGQAVDTTWVDKQIGEINAALASLGSDVSIDSLDNLQQAFDALESVDLSNVNFEEALGPVTDLAGDVGGLGTEVAEAKAQIEELTGVDLSGLSFDAPVSSAETLSSKASTARSKVALVAAEMHNLDGLKSYADIFIRQHGSTNVALPYAEGGILSSPHVGLVAEDGPEAIIPLGGKRRGRGLDLWMEAGRLLGVGAYAEGGILGPYSSMLGSLPDDVWDDDGDGSGDYKPSIATGNNGGGGSNVVQVSVDVNPEYNVNGGDDPEAVLEILRTHQNELAELLGSAMANQLEDIISNM